MEKQIAAVEAAIAQLTERVNLCAKYIKLLTVYSPTQQFRVQLFEQDAIDSLVIDVADADVHFVQWFFMSWHATYSRRLEACKRELAVLISSRLVPGGASAQL